MRKILLLIPLLYGINSYSQVLLGRSKDYIQGVSSSHSGVVVKPDSNNKSMIMWNGDNPKIFNCAYYFTNDICNVCMMNCDYSAINATINSFNNDYVSTGELAWTDHGPTDIYIQILKSQYFFTILYSTK